MAPEKSIGKNMLRCEKELTVWPACTKAESVASSFVCLTIAERDFGISFKVIL
jgi:hypothetical protein